MKLKVLVLTMSLLLCTSSLIFAEGNHGYIGVKKCSMCHRSKSKGNQYGQWVSTKHSRAYEVLGTPEAKATAEKAGISGNPQEAPECLRCHVTAFGADENLLGLGFKKEDGIQCEACHGGGADYKSMSTMKDRAKAIEAGMIMPTEEVCVKCHNEESPNFPGFDFEEHYKKITHPRP